MFEVGKLLKPTFQYLKSKGLFVFLMVLVPSILTCFLISPSSMLYFLYQFKDLKSYDFVTMITKLYGLDTPYFYLGIIGVIAFVFVIAFMFGIVDKHMRMGEFKLSFSTFKSSLNYNFLTTLKFTILILVIFELYNILNMAFAFLWATAFDTFTAVLLFTILSYFILSFILLFSLTSIILWPQNQIHMGMNTKSSLGLAIRQIGENAIRVGFLLMIFTVPFAVLMLLNSLFKWGVIARIALDSLALATVTTVYIIVMHVIFYDITGTERMDLQNVDFWKILKGKRRK